MKEPKKQHYVLKHTLKISELKRIMPLSSVFFFHLKNITSQVEGTGAERNFYTLENFEDKYLCEIAYAEFIELLLESLLKDIRQKCENFFI